MTIPKWPEAGERELELLREVLASGQWGGFHEMVRQFEESFAAFQHCRYGVSVCNGTVALEMALQVAGVGPGDEVIIPAISFISSATAVSRVGAMPVFVDIEQDGFNIDPECAARAVTAKTRAIMPVHFGGPVADMDRLTELARSRNLILIEDAAHAHGSEWNGKRAGSFGLAGSFSFQNGKVITAGEGGMLTTNDTAFAERLRAFANCGRKAGESFYFHFTLGTNLRMTAFQAAVLIAQLERLPDQIRHRAASERRLRGELADVEGISFRRVPMQVTAHSHYLLVGRIDAARFGKTRDEFQRGLAEAGIPCTPFYPHTLYQNPLYRDGGCRVEPCPISEARVRDAFWFPHRLLMGDEQLIREVAAVIRRMAAKQVAGATT